jgi:cytochrome P450
MHPLFNLTSPEFIRDPYPFYERLRTTDPYYRSPFGFFAVSRDRDVRTVLTDKRFGRDLMSRGPQGISNPLFQKPVMRSTGNWMLFRDPPDHTRLRGLVVKAFTAKRIQDLRSRIQDIVDQALDRLAQQSQSDLMADFANRIPATVICDLLGIPQEDREMFRVNSSGLVRLLDPVPLSPAEIDRAGAQHRILSDYLDRLFERRRKNPGDDLTSQLVLAEEQGDRLSTEELTDNMILLFAAGYDTTAGLIGNALLALFRHPDQLARLHADPSLMGNAVEEFLRYDSSVQLSSRVALEELRLGDRTVPRGAMVVCVLGSANRDPEVYDEPDRLDIARRDIRVVSFGGGIHHCLGAQLARLEAEIALGSIIRRFPGLKLDKREQPVWRTSMTLRALARLAASL